MDNFSIKEIFCTDLSRVYVITDENRRPAERYDLRMTPANDLYYVSPFLCVGIDGGSTEVELSNVRVFKRIFLASNDWVVETGGDNLELIGIRIDCRDQAIIAAVQNLQSDPYLDKIDSELLIIEMEATVWRRNLRRKFIKSIERKFKTHFSEIPEDILFDFYNSLKASSGVSGHIANLSFSIDLQATLTSLKKLPEFLLIRSTHI
jgi:hypothetical protein